MTAIRVRGKGGDLPSRSEGEEGRFAKWQAEREAAKAAKTSLRSA